MPSAGKASPTKALILACHDAQQAALARPVQAEHADLRARQERQPDVFENDVVGLVNLAQTLHGVDELRHVLAVALTSNGETLNRITADNLRVQEPFTAESAERAEHTKWLSELGGLGGARLLAPRS